MAEHNAGLLIATRHNVKRKRHKDYDSIVPGMPMHELRKCFCDTSEMLTLTICAVGCEPGAYLLTNYRRA